MQQLIIDGRPSRIFFEDVGINIIVDWINENLNNFGLLEEHSAYAQLCDDGEILISGDEDYMIVRVKTVIPIKLR